MSEPVVRHPFSDRARCCLFAMLLCTDANEMHHSPMSMTTDTQSISPNSTLDRPRSTPPYFSAGVSVNAANVSDQDTITTALRDLINNPHDLEPLNLLPSERQQKLMSHVSCAGAWLAWRGGGGGVGRGACVPPPSPPPHPLKNFDH